MQVSVGADVTAIAVVVGVKTCVFAPEVVVVSVVVVVVVNGLVGLVTGSPAFAIVVLVVSLGPIAVARGSGVGPQHIATTYSVGVGGASATEIDVNVGLVQLVDVDFVFVRLVDSPLVGSPCRL